MGMTLDENGLFRIHDAARVAGESEEDVDAAPRVTWIPAGRREDPAEIDAQAQFPVAMEV
jgi:DNA polymerase/3'-5' exonuclease PolX